MYRGIVNKWVFAELLDPGTTVSSWIKKYIQTWRKSVDVEGVKYLQTAEPLLLTSPV